MKENKNMSGDTMKDIIDRVKTKRIELGYSFQDLAELTGMSKSTLQRYETGGIKNIPLNMLKVLAMALKVTPEWIIGADVYKTDETRNSYVAETMTPVYYKKRVPILGRISAGLPLLAVEHIESYASVEDESIDYGLIVKGDSMIGARIFENDIVYVARDAFVENGDIVIALINGDDATIKRFYQYDNEIILRPENPTIKEQHYRPGEVHILGKVKEVKFRVK
jgi:repressor LexA